MKRNYRKGAIEMSMAEWADFLEHLESAQTDDQQMFAMSIAESFGEELSFNAEVADSEIHDMDMLQQAG